MEASALLHRLSAVLLLAAAAESTPALRGAQGTFPLCNPDIVAETCQLMDPKDDTHVSLVNISTILSATHGATVRFWKALDLKHEHEKCQDFCDKLVRLLQHDGIHLPPGHDLGCVETHDGEMDCSMPLGAEDIENFTDHTEHDLADYHEGEALVGSPAHVVDEIPEDQKLDYSIDEMAVRVANLFRIYPELKVHITERFEHIASDGNVTGSFRYNDYGYGGHSYTPQWKLHLQQVNQKAQAYVSTAIRQMLRPHSNQHLATWFGSGLQLQHLAEVRRVLNSVDQMLGNVEYVYPGPKCSPRTYAYVYPKAYTCSMSELSSNYCTKSRTGKFVFYMCELTMKSRLPEQIETLTHEGSHHAVAYTDDVDVPWSPGQTAYGRYTCKQLAMRSRALSLKNADNYCYFIQDATDKR